MKKGKFLTFLIIALAFTAFLAGYVLVEMGADTSSKTGTILDRFDGQEPIATNEEVPFNTAPMLLIDRPVISATVSSTGEILYYAKDSGELFELDLETKAERSISDRRFPNLIAVFWSPLKNSSINVFSSGDSRSFKYYNITTGEESDLGPNIYSIAFSTNGQYLAYFYSEPPSSDVDPDDPDYIDRGAAGKVIIAQPDGSYKKTVLNTRLTNAIMGWPTANSMSLTTLSHTSDVFLLNEAGSLRKVLDKKSGLRELWSFSGNKLLFSIGSQGSSMSQPALWLKDLASETEKSLAITGDASLCAWSIDDISVFCVISKSPSEDEIYAINKIGRA